MTHNPKRWVVVVIQMHCSLSAKVINFSRGNILVHLCKSPPKPPFDLFPVTVALIRQKQPIRSCEISDCKKRYNAALIRQKQPIRSCEFQRAKNATTSLSFVKNNQSGRAKFQREKRRDNVALGDLSKTTNQVIRNFSVQKTLKISETEVGDPDRAVLQYSGWRWELVDEDGTIESYSLEFTILSTGKDSKLLDTRLHGQFAWLRADKRHRREICTKSVRLCKLFR